MVLRKSFLVLAFAATAHLSSAAQPKPFTQQEFERLAMAGQPVVVDVAASWCSTCKVQKPIIDRLATQERFKGVEVLTVDFDTEKAFVNWMRVPAQSTLIAFKGGREVGRSVGDTSLAGIESIFIRAAE